MNYCRKVTKSFSKVHFHAINLEDAADACLAYLVRVKQFELLGALVEVVAQGDAVAPALDLPLFIQNNSNNCHNSI